MKKFLTLALAIVAFVATASAQSAQDKKAQREALLAAQIQAQATELELTAEQTSQFDVLYREYRAEVRRSQTKIPKVAEGDLTDEIALENQIASLRNSIAKTEVKISYAQPFANIMGGIKVQKFYKNEDKINKRVQKEMKNNH